MYSYVLLRFEKDEFIGFCSEHSSDDYILLQNSCDDSYLAASIERATTASMVGTNSKAVICISYIVYYLRLRIAMYIHQPV